MIFAAIIIVASFGQTDDIRSEAKKKLEEALRSPDVRVRLTAVRVLPAKPCADVEPLLKIAAADEKFNVRLAVVDKLEEIDAGKPGGCADLRPIATYDDDLSLAEYRTHKMLSIGPSAGRRCSLKTDWTALKESCVQDNVFKIIMRGDHKEARYYGAMRAMAESPALRGDALRILRGALRDSAAGPKRPGVEKTEGWVVRWAPLMLEHVPDRDRLPILRAALRYRGDANVRTNAVDAIGRYNIAPDQKLVLLAASAKDKSAQVRWRVARALGSIDSPRAKELMKALAKDKSWWVRREAARWTCCAYERAKADAREAADRCESTEVNRRIGSLMPPDGSVKWVAQVANLLNDPETVVRLCAVDALRTMMASASPELRKAMASPDFRVSLRAAGAILRGTH